MFLYSRMDKESFLRLQYLRMINSDDFVAEQWRSSVDRFITDMWDRTPNSPVGRFLEPIDPMLGFSPDNVEYHFRRVRKKSDSGRKPTFTAPSQSIPAAVPRPTKAERKALLRADAALAREAKRREIAAELRGWEDGALVRQDIKAAN